jgi:hypothetical protein
MSKCPVAQFGFERVVVKKGFLPWEKQKKVDERY